MSKAERNANKDSEFSGVDMEQTEEGIDKDENYGISEHIERHDGSLLKLSRRLSKQLIRQRSSMIESLPETPAGWTVLIAALLSAGLGYEIRLQQSLTQPPCTFGQLPHGGTMSRVHDMLTMSSDSILSRPIQPSLFVGTRGVVSSTAAYLLGGPSLSQHLLRFREIVQSPIDGAAFGVDWEVPWKMNDSRISQLTSEQRQREICNGTIREPVVIILHGINNDASFGYMRSLQRSFADRGWNAAAMNFRGCGGVPMTTPRGYNAAYTNDLRSLVWIVSGRLAENVPVFLVGNSLGASVMTKYLGEEGMSGTLPKCVSGAASLGNPLSINSSLVTFPFNVLMAMGVKKTFLKNYSVFTKMKDFLHQQSFRNALLSTTVAKLDNSMAPILARNNPFYPFAFRIGYKDGRAYWLDSSSFRLLRYISIPYLNLTAEDDFLVAAPNKNKLGFCIANPNIMVVETRCGGHLGWQESPPKSQFGVTTSWADVAAADFFDAVMRTNLEQHGSPRSVHQHESVVVDDDEDTIAARQSVQAAASKLMGSNRMSKL